MERPCWAGQGPHAFDSEPWHRGNGTIITCPQAAHLGSGGGQQPAACPARTHTQTRLPCSRTGPHKRRLGIHQCLGREKTSLHGPLCMVVGCEGKMDPMRMLSPQVAYLLSRWKAAPPPFFLPKEERPATPRKVISQEGTTREQRLRARILLCDPLGPEDGGWLRQSHFQWLHCRATLRGQRGVSRKADSVPLNPY